MLFLKQNIKFPEFLLLFPRPRFPPTKLWNLRFPCYFKNITLQNIKPWNGKMIPFCFMELQIRDNAHFSKTRVSRCFHNINFVAFQHYRKVQQVLDLRENTGKLFLFNTNTIHLKFALFLFKCLVYTDKKEHWMEGPCTFLLHILQEVVSVTILFKVVGNFTCLRIF